MAVYVVTPLWGRTWVGASETYITPDYSPTQAASKISAFLLYRANLMHTNSYWTGVRIGLYGGNRRSSLLLPPEDLFPDTGAYISVPSAGNYVSVDISSSVTLMRNSLQYNFIFDTNRSAARYLADIPSGIVGGEPVTFIVGSNPGWIAAFNQFRGFLAGNSWQIRALDKGVTNPPLQVIGVVTSAVSPNNIGIVIKTASDPGITQGMEILTQKFRAAKGTREPTLNGHWVVDSVDLSQAATKTIVYLRNSSGINAAAQRITAFTIIRKRVFALYPIQAIATKRVVTHKRGKPSGSYLGRRLIRPSLDP